MILFHEKVELFDYVSYRDTRYRACFHVCTRLSLFRQISDRDHENVCHRLAYYLVRLQLQR